jgi:hypothetical protein
MPLRTHGRVWRRVAFVGFALYAAFLFAAPFEHHDLSCELKTPQHCTACTASLLSSDPGTPDVPGVLPFADAGTPQAAAVRAHRLLLAVRSAGRSPPAA